MSEEGIKRLVRTRVVPSDEKLVEDIVKSTAFFRPDEIEVAVELVGEYLQKGSASGYEFMFMEVAGKSVAYACYGLIPCTLFSYDLYWIATHQDYQGQGFGAELLRSLETAISMKGGKTIYVETSSQAKYEPTRKFYLKNGYSEKTRFEDFYAEGDDKVVYIKRL